MGNQPQQQASSAASNPSSSQSKSSPLSPADQERLKSCLNATAKANQASWAQANAEERKDILAGAEKKADMPDSELPPERRALRARMFESQKVMQALLKAPRDSLSPELQQLQRQYIDIQAQVDAADDTLDVRRRMNELLRVNAEEEDIPFAHLAATGLSLSPAESRKVYTEFQARFHDLEARKPKLHAKLQVMFREYVSVKQAEQAKVDVNFC